MKATSCVKRRREGEEEEEKEDASTSPPPTPDCSHLTCPSVRLSPAQRKRAPRHQHSPRNLFFCQREKLKLSRKEEIPPPPTP